MDRGHFFFGGFESGLIFRRVALGLHFQTRFGGGGGYERDDDFMVHEGFAPPVLRDVAKQAVLDFVPLAGGRGKMTHADLEPGFAAQFRETPFPESAS